MTTELNSCQVLSQTNPDHFFHPERSRRPRPWHVVRLFGHPQDQVDVLFPGSDRTGSYFCDGRIERNMALLIEPSVRHCSGG